MDVTAAYHNLTENVASLAGDDHALLHVNIGLAIYLLFHVVMGTRRGSLPALALLAGLAACNMVVDRLYVGNSQPGVALQDMALTLLWPTLLIMANHFRRWRWRALQPAARRQFTPRLVPATRLGVTKTAVATTSPRQPPRLRVFPGYAKRGPV